MISMKKPIILLLALLTPFFAFPHTSSEVRFLENDIEEAKKIAAMEGKLILVHFTAEWCMPCQWMEEHTFRQSELAQYLNQYYLPVRVDIDNYRGFAEKEKYQIRLLPSLLIFNSSGNLLGKFEESMTSERLMELLTQFNLPVNRRVAPRVQDEDLPTSAMAHVRKPALDTREEAAQPAVARPVFSNVHQSDAGRHTPARVAAAEPAGYITNRQPVYGIQVGAFGSYQNVVTYVKELEQNTSQPVEIYPENSGGKTYFRVVVGKFGERQSAYDYLRTLNQQGITGYIKDTSTF